MQDTLSPWMRRAQTRARRARLKQSADRIHRLRLALRRCISLAECMLELDSHPGWKKTRKIARRLFKPLGRLRDLQLMAEGLKSTSAAADLEMRVRDARREAQDALDEFDQRRWKSLRKKLGRHLAEMQPDRPAIVQLALRRLELVERLDEAAALHHEPETVHQLRIAIKRFRYTLENLLPEHYAREEEWLRRVQTLLGAICDGDRIVEYLEQVQANPELQRQRQKLQRARAARWAAYQRVTKNQPWPAWRMKLGGAENHQK